jgi:hypothetical protein
MEFEDKITKVKTRGDLAEFVSGLRADLDNHPERWENDSLPNFLEAMATWIEDMDQYYRNRGEEFSENQPWALFGTILLAARGYE